jgi:thioredoxin-like negative regulator of GroEL
LIRTPFRQAARRNRGGLVARQLTREGQQEYPAGSAVANERIGFLHEALEANPSDVFARYALAMELAADGQNQEAWQHFDYLLSHHPDYSPTYYQAGMFLLQQGNREGALKLLSKGIEVTGREGKPHAQNQLRTMLDTLGAVDQSGTTAGSKG